MNNNSNNIRFGQVARFVYTYHLPYAIRRSICDILDADKSWRTLGGNFIGLDATQLTLIGQAYLRNGSPTEDLLNKLDSANFRISDFCYYLEQMNHCRALEILKPCMEMIDAQEETGNIGQASICPASNMAQQSAKSKTLDTPTPSFIEQSAGTAIMSFDETFNLYPDYYKPGLWNADENQLENKHDSKDDHQPEAPTNSLRGVSQAPTKQIENNQNRPMIEARHEDPGEEIVRMACANNRKRTSISDQEVVNQLRLIMQINYNELKQASDNFSDSNILGNGGFASVYRGNWKGTDVAIKRLKCNLMDQALNELTILNSYRIDNILPIYGISIDGPEACLVYQFMSNGSLEDRLSCKKETPPLTWNQRALIGEGVAKGLYYLHTLRDKPLVHGDVKSANVLLDSQFVPKLGDFGLARQVFKGKTPKTELCTHCTVSSIHGTSVYLPAEYLRHKILSPAVDVYSYGIVLLEMATGKRAYDGKRLLIDIVEEETRYMSMGQIGYSLKDPRLADDTENDLKIWYELLIKLGLNCAHKMKRRRLDMGQVLSRFAEFRSNSQYLISGVNNNPVTLSSNGSTTARTLVETPDFSELERHQASAENNFGENQIQSHFPRVASLVQNYNSALMSVEEESELMHNNLNQDTTQEQQRPNTPIDQQVAAPDQLVEAMIPLLTELGVTTGEPV